MIEIITGLLICPFIEFLNICQQIGSFSLCFSVISVRLWFILPRRHGASPENKQSLSNSYHLHLKLRLVFKELRHFIIHFKAIIHR